MAGQEIDIEMQEDVGQVERQKYDLNAYTQFD